MLARLLAVSFGLATVCAIAGCDGKTVSSVAAANEKHRTEMPTDEPASNVEPAKCELRLELPATIKSKTPAHAKVRIKNVSKSDVTLVMPGDGSDCRWRTPIVGWSFLSSDSKDQHPKEPACKGGARCGNINRLKPNEVFSLKPGETKELNEWISFPYQLPPGKYRVVFYYSNVPELKWSGVPLGEHDAGAMRSITRSTEIAIVSNEVQLEVAE